MRKSILTDYCDISAFSGKPNPVCHHLIFGRGLRDLSDADLLTIFVTAEEHNCSTKGTIYQIHDNPAAEKLSKMLGQIAWEKEYIACVLSELSGSSVKEIKSESREKFMKRYGQSWL